MGRVRVERAYATLSYLRFFGLQGGPEERSVTFFGYFRRERGSNRAALNFNRRILMLTVKRGNVWAAFASKELTLRSFTYVFWPQGTGPRGVVKIGYP